MEDEQRRLKKAWQSEEKARARAAFPLPDEELGSLFDSVDARLSTENCDHSLRFTKAWLAQHSCAAPPVLEWLADNGGYCDCEVVTNARDEWERARVVPDR